MPNREGRPNCAPRIACRRLHIDLLERSPAPNLSVRYGVHGATAGQRQLLHAICTLSGANKIEEGLLVNCLRRPRDITMMIFDRVRRLPSRTEKFLQGRRK